MSSIARIDLNFEQNWEPVMQWHRYLHNLIIEKKSSNVKGKWIDGINGLRYDFGPGGSIFFFDLVTPVPGLASGINGKQVEKFLPWAEQLKSDISELKFTSLALQRSIGGLGEHVDGQESPETTEHCKLNFIITGSDAVTYLKDGDQLESYPSIANTAWLIDTTKPHWVTGDTERFVFQLCFIQSFQEVKEWFDNHPGLTYKQ